MTKSNEDKSSWLQLGDPMDLESAGGYRRTSGGGPNGTTNKMAAENLMLHRNNTYS